ncbi:MAG: sulfatase, partial [Gemmatimonadetes bacterium]|nr:sulfatase [Gemmatimonadota bacterium]
YLLLLLPTLYFKYSYLNSLAEEGVLAAVATGSLVRSVARYVTLFDADFVQVLLVVTALYVIGHLLLRINLDVLAAAAVLVCMLVSAGNWLSFQVIGSLLNADNLEIALSWLKEHPETVTRDQGGKLLLISAGGLLLLAVLWTAVCFLAIRGGVSDRTASSIARVTLGVALVLQLVAGAGTTYRALHPRPGQGTSMGYWSSTVKSLRGAEHWAPLELTLPAVATIESHYREIAYGNSTPLDAGGAGESNVRIPSAQRVPRHIVIISLETAARKYYPLLDDAGLPTFSRMAGRGISSEYHLSTNPATTWAIYSMLTGTYPRRGRSLLDYGDFDSDGLASVLGRHGYETTFLDSYKIDWQSGFHRDHNSRMVKDLGFMSIEDITTDSAQHASGDAFDIAVARERRSLTRALNSIDDARGHRAHAFVFIATILGHFPWASPETAKNHAGAAKLAAIAGTLDTLVGEFLAGVDKRGLADSIIVVVTGDHGLRSKSEFGSLGENMRFGTISFNVPFVLYAPGLFDRGVRMSHVTSHVDIAPTLFELVGISSDSLLLHGSSMLDPSVERRTTFMFNNSLRPVDGYYRDGWLYIYNAFTGEARAERAPGTMARPDPQGFSPGVAPSLAFTTSVAGTLDRAAGIFDTTSAFFLQRRARTGAGAHAALRAAH